MHDTVTDPALAGTPEGARALRDLAEQHRDGARRGPGPAGRGAAPARPPAVRGGGAAPPRRRDREDAVSRTTPGRRWPSSTRRPGDFSKAAELLRQARRARRPEPLPLRGPPARGRGQGRARPPRRERSRCCSARWPDAPGASRRPCSSSARSRSSADSGARPREALDRLDRDYPATAAGPRRPRLRLRKLAADLPAATPQEKIGRDLKKALVLFEAGEHRDAVKLFQALLLRKPSPADADLIRVRLGRVAPRPRQGRAGAGDAGRGAARARRWSRRPPTSSRASRRGRPTSPAAYASVATRFPGTSWGEEALLDAAAYYARSGKDEDALPFYRRIYEGYPQGKYVDPATFRVGFAEYRARRFDKAAEIFEAAAKVRSSNLWRPAYLYWAGRARREMGQEDRARALLEEVLTPLQVRLSRHPRPRGAGPRPRRARRRPIPRRREGLPAIPEPYRTRVRNLLLIERLAGGDGRARGRAPQPDRAGHAQLDLLAPAPAAAGHHGHEARLSGVGDGERRSASPTPCGRSCSPSSSATCSPATPPRPASIPRWWRPSSSRNPRSTRAR